MMRRAYHVEGEKDEVMKRVEALLQKRLRQLLREHHWDSRKNKAARPSPAEFCNARCDLFILL